MRFEIIVIIVIVIVIVIVIMIIVIIIVIVIIRFRDLGCRGQGLGLRLWGVRFRDCFFCVWGVGFRGLGLALGLRFRVRGFRVQRLRLGASNIV